MKPTRYRPRKAISENIRRAKAAGATTYRTHVPCRYGHDAARYVANNNCVEAGHAPGVIGVRDSRSPAMVLELTPAAWTAFTTRLRG